MRSEDDHDRGAADPEPRPKRAPLGLGGWLVIVILFAFLGVSIWFAIDAWNSTGDVEISMHGKIAMTLGIVLTFLLGAGLMALVFWSNRKGFDR